MMNGILNDKEREM